MIGQAELKKSFTNNFIKKNKALPRSIMLVGAKGSGRKTFANWLMENANLPLITIGQKADDVRELSELCYKLVEPTYYLIADVDQMSGAAQNALLKILEEPPNNAGFIITALYGSSILPTISSRCTKYYMDTYSQAELEEFINLNYNISGDDKSVILSICTCPGDIELFLTQNIQEFVKYVDRVFNNIAKVSGPNSFKIANKINLTDDNTKYDLSLFWRAFSNKCLDVIHSGKYKKDECAKYISACTITNKYLQDMRIKGLNKQIAFDNWLLDIRKEWI